MTERRMCRTGVLALFAICLIFTATGLPAYAQDPPTREEILRELSELEQRKKKLLEMLETTEAVPEAEKPPPPEEAAPIEPEPQPEPEAVQEERTALMKQVVIIANRYAVEAERVTSTVERYEREDIDRRQVPRVQEIIKETPGVPDIHRRNRSFYLLHECGVVGVAGLGFIRQGFLGHQHSLPRTATRY